MVNVSGVRRSLSGILWFFHLCLLEFVGLMHVSVTPAQDFSLLQEQIRYRQEALAYEESDWICVEVVKFALEGKYDQAENHLRSLEESISDVFPKDAAIQRKIVHLRDTCRRWKTSPDLLVPEVWARYSRHNMDGNSPEAIKALDELVRRMHKRIGTDNAIVVELLLRKASLYAIQGNDKRAISALSQARNSLHGVLAGESRDYAYITGMVGAMEWKLGHGQEASEALQKAHDILHAIHGYSGPRTFSLGVMLAELQVSRGEIAKARVTCSELLFAKSAILIDKGQWHHRFLLVLAEVQYESGKASLAKLALERAATGFERVPTSDDWSDLGRRLFAHAHLRLRSRMLSDLREDEAAIKIIRTAVADAEQYETEDPIYLDSYLALSHEAARAEMAGGDLQRSLKLASTIRHKTDNMSSASPSKLYWKLKDHLLHSTIQALTGQHSSSKEELAKARLLVRKDEELATHALNIELSLTSARVHATDGEWKKAATHLKAALREYKLAGYGSCARITHVHETLMLVHLELQDQEASWKSAMSAVQSCRQWAGDLRPLLPQTVLLVAAHYLEKECEETFGKLLSGLIESEPTHWSSKQMEGAKQLQAEVNMLLKDQ